jgi:hypothetical protein
MKHYHVRSWLAIVTGTLATAGALAILLADPIVSGAWRLDHGLLPIIVGITIAAGHLVGTAARQRRALSALGFAAIFVLGTALTVYSSVGSQKQANGNAALGVDAHNRAIADKRTELAAARNRLTMAETMVERETANKRCGQACADWKARAAEVRSHVAVIEASIARLGSEKVARPKAQAFAELAAVFGADRGKIEHAASVLEPPAYSFLLELTAIVAFGFGFGQSASQHGNRTENRTADRTNIRLNAAVTAPDAPRQPDTEPDGRTDGGSPHDGLKPPPGRMSKAQTLDYLRTLRTVGQSLPTQAELTQRTGRPKQTISDWLGEWERSGEIQPRRTVSRTKQLA